MYTSRKNSQVIEKAIDLLKHADRILFMGFGYDLDNLNILGIPESIKHCYVFGTAKDNSKNEIQHKKGLLSGTFDPMLISEDCLILLKEYLI